MDPCEINLWIAHSCEKVSPYSTLVQTNYLPISCRFQLVVLFICGVASSRTGLAFARARAAGTTRIGARGALGSIGSLRLRSFWSSIWTFRIW